MRRLNALVVLLLLSALLAGCASSAIEIAPEQPDRPWTPATTSAGEIIPDEKPPPLQPRSDTFVLPSNTALAELPPPLELDRDKVYSLPELIDIAQSSNPSTRRAWNAAKEAALAAGIAKTSYLPRITATAVGGWQMLQSTPAVETGRERFPPCPSSGFCSILAKEPRSRKRPVKGPSSRTSASRPPISN